MKVQKSNKDKKYSNNNQVRGYCSVTKERRILMLAEMYKSRKRYSNKSTYGYCSYYISGCITCRQKCPFGQEVPQPVDNPNNPYPNWEIPGPLTFPTGDYNTPMYLD